MCNVTIQAGMGLVKLMLFNKEMEKGLKFYPKFKQLQVRAKALRTYLKAKTSVHKLFSFVLSPVHKLVHILNISH